MSNLPQVNLDQPIRGVPLWLLREYLEELGGQACGAEVVVGADWRVELSAVAPFQLGSLRIGQVALHFSGEASALAALRAALGRKLMTRGGG